MSKVQFNLLPDSKLAFNRTQHTQRLVYTIAVAATIVSLAVLLLMVGVVYGLQKKMMSDAGTKVDKASSQLQALNIDKIITVQNQLSALTQLHQNKHMTSRIFTYLPEITPPNVSIDKLDLDLAKNTMTISGTASSQKDVNTFVDVLKFTTYKVGSTGSPAAAFQQVVESGFNLNVSSVGYTIDMQFDPKLFANNLKDASGKPAVPQMSLASSLSGGTLKDPSSTLFNSTQSSAEQK